MRARTPLHDIPPTVNWRSKVFMAMFVASYFSFVMSNFYIFLKSSDVRSSTCLTSAVAVCAARSTKALCGVGDSIFDYCFTFQVRCDLLPWKDLWLCDSPARDYSFDSGLPVVAKSLRLRASGFFILIGEFLPLTVTPVIACNSD